MEQQPAPLLAAGNRIRETAKWLTVSLAVLGGVLMAGTQLSSIGQVEPGSQRFLIALAGACAGVVGTVLILFGTVWTATTPPVNFFTLKPKKYLKDPMLLQGKKDINSLRAQYVKALEKKVYYVAANRQNANRHTHEAATNSILNLKDLDGIVRNVLQVASYEKLRRRWRIAAAIISVGAILGSCGVAVFVWAINPPTNAVESVVSPVSVGEVSRMAVSLTPEGGAALGASLGSTCPITEPVQVVVLKESPSGADIVVQDPRCKQIRILLTPAWGTLEKPGAPPPTS